MTILPIVERELRVRSRNRWTITFRFLAAVTGIVIVGLVLLANAGSGGRPGLGSSVFSFLVWLCLAYCLFEGPRNTADSLSREKRDGTLGLLFLTDLRGYDVILGKLVANSLNSFYGLLAVVPPLAIPLVLGGVTPDEFWRHLLALANTLFFSLTIGLFISSVQRDERSAWSLTVSLVVLLGVVPPFFQSGPSGWISALSPITALVLAGDSPTGRTPDLYWQSLQVTHLLSWTLLAVASVLLPRCWQERPSGSAPRRRRWLARWRPCRPGRETIADANPVAWLAARDSSSNTGLWMVVIVGGLVAAVTWLLNVGSGPMVGVLIGAMFVLHLALSVWMASEACHLFGAARESGALELLLVTPLTTGEILAGPMAALRRIFFGPIAALISIELLLIAAHVWIGIESGEPWFACLVVAAGVIFAMAVFVQELWAVASFGLWMGLVTPRRSRAITKTVLYVVVFPMLALACYPIYPVIGLAKNFVFINYGRDQLRRHFRAIVAEPFASPREAAKLAAHSRRTLPPVLPR